ncbi:Cyclin, N-terminal domain containing protein [Tritrichomonas foetus]|uniref:Cyclin, N-terminal domain containing protein n=1 Tax=Tritrichomonas foetus TaxID=1144522 RepID=A0A1J4L4L4_9EUKA|nr:Cyclin, N-terminal domain containing protein [Tritrichomonas foetus]|eukprot:OHT16878.1 Cyclin, N-terminal domain containing protein [Tritrichomonas foetus]
MPARLKKTSQVNCRWQNDSSKAKQCTNKRKKLPKFDSEKIKFQDEYSDPSYDDDSSSDEFENMTQIDIKQYTKPMYCPQYAEKIIINAQKEEAETRIQISNFHKIQTEITMNMRSIVIRWLINVHHDFAMSSETLFNAIYFFDYTLSQVNIPKSEIQLLGTVCLMMAAKIDELKPPNISEIIELCSTHYKISEFEVYERLVFRTLNYRLHYPHTKTFLKRYLNALEANSSFSDIANFICEASLFCYDLNIYNPSAVAVAIIVITSCCLKSVLPLKKLHLYSHISNFQEIEEIIILLVFSAKEVLESRKGAIYQRYTDPRSSGSLLNLKFDDDLMKHIQRLHISTK